MKTTDLHRHLHIVRSQRTEGHRPPSEDELRQMAENVMSKADAALSVVDKHLGRNRRTERRRAPGAPASGRLDRLSAEIGYRAHRLADDVLPWCAAVALVWIMWWLS